MPIILNPQQRDTHERLVQVKAISEICEQNSRFWIDQLKITKNVLSNMSTMKNDKVRFKPEQIIGYTVMPLSQTEKELIKEIEKLKYRESVSDRMTYDRLEKIAVTVPGLIFGVCEKAMYIILAELAEKTIYKN